MALTLPASRLRSGPTAMEQIGRGNGQEAKPRHVFLEDVPGGDRLGHYRAHANDRGFRILSRLAQPVAALQRGIAPAIIAALFLSDVSGREPEVGAFASWVVDQPEGLF